MSSRVAKNTVLLLSASVAQKVLSFAYFTLIARAGHIGVEGTGAYVTALSFSTMFSILADIGMNPALVREVAKERARANHLLSIVLAVKIFAALASYALLIATVHFSGYAPLVRELVWFTGLVMILDAIHLSFYGVLRGFEELRFESLGVISGQSITLLAGFTVLALKLPVVFLVGALALGSLWNVLWGGITLFRRFHVRVSFSIPWSAIKPFLIAALPFAIAGAFARVYAQSDTLLVAKIAGLHAAGWYSVPYKISFAFQFIPLAFGAALYPAMSNLWAGSREKLGPLFVKSMTYLAMIGFPIGVGISVLARPVVLTFFGVRYEPSILPLQILMIALAIGFLDFPPGALLNASGRQTSQTAVMGITAVSNIILNLILIPRFGPAGAAISALLGNTILTAGSWMLMQRVQKYDARALWARLGKILFSSLLMGGVLFVVPSVPLIFRIAIGVGVYGLALALTKAMTIGEIREFLHALKLRKIFQSESTV